MRMFIAMLLGCVLANSAAAQLYSSQGSCANGQCPIVRPSGPLNDGVSQQRSPADLQIDASAIVRVVNSGATSRTAGSGTLVDVDSGRGLIVTCAHLFRDGVGKLSVTFPNQQSFDAQLLKVDGPADLAALSIAAPQIKPAIVAAGFPRLGDPLVSCGYGSDGRLWCNRGQALGYVSTAGGHGTETLELSGAARSGDSGGPVFDRQHQLVAVLFGTNGRVVDATFCGRVRQFLAGLSPRFQSAQPLPRGPRPAKPLPEQPPLVQVPPPTPSVQPAGTDRLEKLEQLVSRVSQAWQALNAKLDALALALAAANAEHEANSADASEASVPSSQGESPANADPIGQGAEAIDTVARPWLSAKLTALLVSFGVPGGVAGFAAGAVVWLAMRRAKQRLEGELIRLKASRANSPPNASADATAPPDPAVVERHHNQYVAYEVTALDKAWAIRRRRKPVSQLAIPDRKSSDCVLSPRHRNACCNESYGKGHSCNCNSFRSLLRPAEGHCLAWRRRHCERLRDP